MGVLTGVGLWIAQFPYAGMLGLIVAVFSVAPYLGLVPSFIPAIFIALVSGSIVATWEPPGVRLERAGNQRTSQQSTRRGDRRMSESMIKEKESVVIIGSGPAGWTAAVYAARADLSPLVVEGSFHRTMIPGGQLMFTTEVENYPGFKDGVDGQTLMLEMKAQAERFGTRVLTEDVLELDAGVYPFRLRTTSGSEIRAESVIVATGANAKWMGLPNEERLAKSGGGVSACAVCDGALPHFRDKVLAVVGGGDTAMEDALYLTKFAKEVVIVHRRDELRASRIMAERARSNPKIRFEWNSVVTEVHGDDVITGLRLEDTVTGQERDLEVGGLFVAIGHEPNTAFLKGVVELKANGYVKTPVSWRTQTSVPGIFAAGDVMDDYYRQAVTAAGTGCMAALEAERWLAHGGAEAYAAEGAGAR